MQPNSINETQMWRSIFMSFCAAIIFFIPQFATSQDNKMSGKVMYDKQTIVADAMVSILDASDRSLITSGLTNENGSFNFEKLKPGKYFVAIEVFGQPFKVYGPIEIGVKGKHTVLETFYMNKSMTKQPPVVKTSRVSKPVINTAIKIS